MSLWPRCQDKYKAVTVAGILSSKPLWLWLAMYLLWLLGHWKGTKKYSYALSFVAKEPRQVQSKSQLQMFYHENLGEFDCVYTHFGSLDNARKKNIPTHWHCDQGAKASKKQVPVEYVLSTKPQWLWLAMYLLWLLKHCKDRIKYSKQGQSKSQLHMLCHLIVCDCNCICTCFGHLCNCNTKRYIIISCHADQEAKTSTKHVNALFWKPLWLWLAIYLLWILGLCKDRKKYSYVLSMYPRSQDKYKASLIHRSFTMKSSAAVTGYILALAP